MITLLIAVGGGLGALARWAIASWIPKSKQGFPVGITIVNVAGSFLLGFAVGFVSSNEVSAATEPLTLGLLGGFTTFSTWMIDIDEAPRTRIAGVIVVVPLALGVAAAAVGLAIGLR